MTCWWLFKNGNQNLLQKFFVLMYLRAGGVINLGQPTVVLAITHFVHNYNPGWKVCEATLWNAELSRDCFHHSA
jgi:hypothetical protein